MFVCYDSHRCDYTTDKSLDSFCNVPGKTHRFPRMADASLHGMRTILGKSRRRHRQQLGRVTFDGIVLRGEMIKICAINNVKMASRPKSNLRSIPLAASSLQLFSTRWPPSLRAVARCQAQSPQLTFTDNEIEKKHL